MSFDFNVFNTEKAASEGAMLHLVHPTSGIELYVDGDKKRKPIHIHLMGTDSDIYMEYQQKEINKERTRRSKNKSDEAIDFKQNIRDTADLFAKMTKGWANIWHDGKELEFSYQNAVLLYMTYKEIRMQVKAFVEDKENFIKD